MILSPINMHVSGKNNIHPSLLLRKSSLKAITIASLAFLFPLFAKVAIYLMRSSLPVKRL